MCWEPQELAENRVLLTPLRNVPKKKVLEELSKVNSVIEHIPVNNITELNDTFYVSAALITHRLERKRNEGQDPEWRIRLKKKIDKIGSQDANGAISRKLGRAIVLE